MGSSRCCIEILKNENMKANMALMRNLEHSQVKINRSDKIWADYHFVVENGFKLLDKMKKQQIGELN
jgi:hypothetical protein